MGSGFKTFAAAEVLTAANVNNYLMEQSVMSFADATARDAAVTSPEEGMTAYLQDANSVTVYSGSAWVTIADLDVLVVDSANGRVGIGTATPQVEVEVSNESPVLRLTDTDTTLSDNELSSGIEFYSSDTSAQGVAAYVHADGDGATGDLQLRFGTGTPGGASDRMTIDASGKVGIGTDAPSQELDVVGSIVIPVGNGVMFDRSGTDLDVLFKETPTSTTYGTGDDVVLRNPNGANIRFQTDGTNDRMTITEAGKVGIGITNPDRPLHVSTSSTVEVVRFESSDDECGLSMKCTSTNGRDYWLVSGGTGGGFAGGNFGIYDSTPSTGGVRFVVTSAGNIVVNTGTIQSVGTFNNTTAASANMHVSSAGFFYRSTASSIRYKTDVETLEDSYADAILGLRPVWYRSLGKADPDEWGYWGFIAEEVAAIDPRLVTYGVADDYEWELDENGQKIEPPASALTVPEGVQYDRLVPHLVNLVARQRDQIGDLTARIETLEAA